MRTIVIVPDSVIVAVPSCPSTARFCIVTVVCRPTGVGVAVGGAGVAVAAGVASGVVVAAGVGVSTGATVGTGVGEGAGVGAGAWVATAVGVASGAGVATAVASGEGVATATGVSVGSGSAAVGLPTGGSVVSAVGEASSPPRRQPARTAMTRMVMSDRPRFQRLLAPTARPAPPLGVVLSDIRFQTSCNCCCTCCIPRWGPVARVLESGETHSCPCQ